MNSETAASSTTWYGDFAAAIEAAHRAARVPAYAQEWREADLGTTEDDWFSRLPLISKGTLIDAVSDRDPFGGRLAVDRTEVAALFVTPGPLYLPLTRRDLEATTVAQARSLVSSGIRPSDVVDQTVGYQWIVGGALLHRALEHIGCTVVPGGPGQTDLHIQSIAALGVTAIVAFPSFLEHLLNRASQLGLELPLRVASIAGEMSDSNFKSRIEREYGVQVRERYGTAEGGPVAYECHAGNGLHLDDSVLVEFIDPDTGRPRRLDDPEIKEIVVTSPNRRAFPIVRMRTGDLVEALDTTTCECGNSAPRIRRIVGRVSAIPRVKGMFVVPQQVEDVLRRHGLQGRFQLRIDRPERLDRLTIVFESPAEPTREFTALRDELNAALRMRVEIEPTAALAVDAPLVEDCRELS